MTSKSRRASVFLRPVGRAVSLVLALAPALAWADGPDVSVTGGRMQVIMAGRPAAGYFTLRNNGDAPLSLTGASAPDCRTLMLHQSSDQGGMARMAMVQAVPVPPHGSVSFAPGGYHLMCDDPSGRLLSHKGTEPVTLEFAGGGKAETPFTITGAGK